MSTTADESQITKIVSDALSSSTTLMSAESAATLLNTMHPKTIFIKSLPERASVLDLGAGDGSIVSFKSYLEPARPDLDFYAYSLEKGKQFDAFKAYELNNWNVQRPDFGGMNFDAIIAAHFIEHIENYPAVVSWCLSRLTPRGRLYLEWPSEYSVAAPRKDVLNSHGVHVQIGNFFDDTTHAQLPDRAVVLSLIAAAGAVVEQQGYIRFPILESALFHFFRDEPFSYPLQAAYWSRTRWCQYIVSARS